MKIPSNLNRVERAEYRKAQAELRRYEALDKKVARLDAKIEKALNGQSLKIREIERLNIERDKARAR